MINIIERTLNYLVIFSAVSFGIIFSIKHKFSLPPEAMSAPGMIICFLITCSLNLLKNKEVTPTKSIIHVSRFANTLTLLYAIGLSIQDPMWAKVITTFMMLIITSLSFMQSPNNSKA